MAERVIDFDEARKRLDDSDRVRCAHCGRSIGMHLTRCPFCGTWFEGEALQFSNTAELAEAQADVLRRQRIAVALFATLVAAVAVAAAAIDRW